MTEFELRLHRLEARAEIAQLVSRYSRANDQRDMTLLEDLLTEDARIWSDDGLMSADGRQTIVDMYHRLFDIRGASYHWTHDHELYFNDDDPHSATGIVMGHGEVTPNGVHYLAAIRYTDKYRQVNNVWYFAERSLAFIYYVPADEYPSCLLTTLRNRVHGDHRPADLPEKLPTWVDWVPAG
jgi:hypothetical protein